MLDKERVGKTITNYRKMRGITQKALADALHISYQAVSKWEAGVSLPAVEMLYQIAQILDVTVDALLSGERLDNRRITYQDTGLDTARLHSVKRRIMELIPEDESLVSCDYADALLFKMDTTGMKEPVYSMVTCVPGSKERFAREHGYDREICMDVAASGMNHLLQHGMKPVVCKAQVLCGNNHSEQLYQMASAFREICEQNHVIFAGMEIAAQAVNYRMDDYKVSATLVGVQDRDKLVTEELIEEGDVLIGLRTEGIDGTNYPFIKVMLDRKPDLMYARIEEGRYFVEELMRPNTAYTKEIMELLEAGAVHGIFRVKNHLLNFRRGGSCYIPEGLGACIDLGQVPILPLYRFLIEQDMIGKKVLPYHFHFGIGMVVAVPREKCEQAMNIIRKYRECWCIGRIEKDKEHLGDKAWTKGQLRV